MAGLDVEQSVVEYDLDDEDERWLAILNGGRSLLQPETYVFSVLVSQCLHIALLFLTLNMMLPAGLS